MCILQHVNIVALFAMIFEFGHYGLVMEHVLLGALDEFTYKYLVGLICLFFGLFKALHFFTAP